MLDVKDMPSSLRNQKVSHRHYNKMWYRQRTGGELPTWAVTTAEVVAAIPILGVLGYAICSLL